MEKLKFQRPTEAVQIGQTSVSHVEMERHVLEAVQWLQSAVLMRGAWVGVALMHDYQHWVMTLALLRLGHPCASTYDVEAMPQAIKDRFTYWVVDTPLRNESGWIQPPQELWMTRTGNQDESSQGNAKPTETFKFQLGAGAKRLILTSGTTGLPKMVGFDVQRIQSRLSALASEYATEFNASTRFLSFMGLDTVSGFFYDVLTWLQGGTVLFGMPTPDGRGRTEFPIAVSNVITAAPARLKELVIQSSSAWPQWEQRVVLSAGSRLHIRVRDDVLKTIAGRVINTYGSTEAGVVALCDSQLLDRHPGTAGYLVPGVVVEILDDDGEVLPHGQEGRLRCKTLGMVPGYEGDGQSSQFQDGWFYPGDRAVLGADGWLIVTGRDTDVINLGGVKLSAVEIETKLQALGELKDVCVVALDESGSHRLAIAVVHDDAVVLEELRTRINAALATKVPFHLVRVPRLPRNAMGKLPRIVIAKKLLEIVEQASSPATLLH